MYMYSTDTHNLSLSLPLPFSLSLLSLCVSLPLSLSLPLSPPSFITYPLLSERVILRLPSFSSTPVPRSTCRLAAMMILR